jgi:hypothetical protein
MGIDLARVMRGTGLREGLQEPRAAMRPAGKRRAGFCTVAGPEGMRIFETARPRLRPQRQRGFGPSFGFRHCRD